MTSVFRIGFGPRFRSKTKSMRQSLSAFRAAALTVVFALDLGATAWAADGLPVKAKAPAAFDWTGFYLGGHIETVRGRASVSAGDPVPFTSVRSFGSFFGGIDLGYNHQLTSGLVLGAEADISVPDAYPSNAEAWSGNALREEIDYVATLRGRVGYATGRWLTYVTGGFAWSSTHQFRTDAATGDDGRRSRMRTGWSAGGGVEYAFQGEWSARLEYLYARLGSADVMFANGATYGSQFDLHMIRLGLNRKLNGGGPRASAEGDTLSNGDRWEIRGQTTYIQQSYPKFRALYTGPNSLMPGAQSRETWSTSAFIGVKLWDGGELYYNPEFLQGFGLSETVGAGGFPNGEAQKSGFLYPRYSTSRLFLRQTFGFGGREEKVESAYGLMAGKKDVDRLTIQIGKFTVHDVFDNNAYAQDSRADFMNWSIWAAGAFDYPADRIGLGYGATAEYNRKDWAIRAGYFLIGDKSNSNNFDMRVGDRGGYVAEYEKRYELFGRDGKLRLLGFFHRSFAGGYRDAIDLSTTTGIDINTASVNTRQTRTKFGYAINLEQSVTDDVGVFSRWSWNNGKSDITAFTDIDSSFSLGTQIKGAKWGRPDDKIGIAGAINGLSKDHRDFLAAGGLGPLIGDGALNYRQEKILETYYAYSVVKDVTLTFDYQFMVNPAYNADRGPVHFFTGRLHAEF